MALSATIQPFLKNSQWLHHFPGQPIPKPSHPFCDEICPNVQSKRTQLNIHPLPRWSSLVQVHSTCGGLQCTGCAGSSESCQELATWGWWSTGWEGIMVANPPHAIGTPWGSENDQKQHDQGAQTVGSFLWPLAWMYSLTSSF